MTGYTVHTGSNEKFSSGWDRIFREPAAPGSTSSAAPKKTKQAAAPKAAATKAIAKQPAAKKAAGKAAKKSARK